MFNFRWLTVYQTRNFVATLLHTIAWIGILIVNFTVSQAIILKDQNICGYEPAQVFEISDPRPCSLRLLEHVQTCSVNVYELSRAVYELHAFECSIETRTQTGYVTFWGVNQKSPVDEVLRPAGISECLKMESDKISISSGKLKLVDDSLYKTDNKLFLPMRWLTNTRAVVTNAYLKYIKFYYNYVADELLSSEAQANACNFHVGHCQIGSKRIVWQIPKDLYFCESFSSALVYSGPSTVQLDGKNDIISVTVENLTSTFKNLEEINVGFRKCFSDPDSLVVTNTDGFALELLQCKHLIHNISKSHLNRNISQILHLHNILASHDHKSVPHEDFAKPYDQLPKSSYKRNLYLISSSLPLEFSYLINSNNFLMISLEAKLNFNLCQMQKLVTMNTKLLAKLFPSTVMSQLFRKPISATNTNDIITTMSCYFANITLKSDMKVSDKIYSNKPLAYLHVPNNTDILLQYTVDHTWTQHIVSTTSAPYSGILAFSIDGIIFTYKNGSLVDTDLNVKQIDLSLHDINIHMPDSNFDASRLLYGDDQVIGDDSLFKNQINLATLKFETEEANLKSETFWASDQAASSVLVKDDIPIVDEVGGTISNTIGSIFHFFNSVYSLIWTLVLVIIFYKLCGRKCRNKFESSESQPIRQVNNPIVRNSNGQRSVSPPINRPTTVKYDDNSNKSKSTRSSDRAKRYRITNASSKALPVKKTEAVCHFKKAKSDNPQLSHCSITTVSKPGSSKNSSNKKTLKNVDQHTITHKTTRM